MLGNVLNLVGILQGINSVEVLPVRSEFKNDLAEEQSIDFGEIPLFGNVLSLIGAL